jgi:hypothetical protein
MFAVEISEVVKGQLLPPNYDNVYHFNQVIASRLFVKCHPSKFAFRSSFFTSYNSTLFAVKVQP